LYWLHVKIKVKGTSVLCFVVWAGSWNKAISYVRIKVKGTSVRIVLLCKLDHRTRQFLTCWLHIKIKVKGTGVRIVLWCGLDLRTRQLFSYVLATHQN